MFIHIIKIIIINFLLLTTMSAQGAKDEAGGKEAEGPFPKNGIRFVICSEGNVDLPSPLYVKVGKAYQPVIITRRMPTPCVPLEGGVVKFYKEIPVDSKKAKGGEEEPLFTINVPEAYRSSAFRTICLVQASDKENEPLRTYFLKEDAFKVGGVHIVNLTTNKLEIITDPTGRFEGNEKTATLAPTDGSQHISAKAPYVWSYISTGKALQQSVSYVLQVKAENSTQEPYRIRASVFMTNKEVSQISIIMQSQKRKNMYVLQSVQYGKELESKRTAGH